MSGYIDGSYQNAFLTSNVISYPLSVPDNGNTIQLTLTWVRAAANYTASNIGATTAQMANVYLTEQGPVEKIGAGIVRYTETYNKVPASWTEKDQVVYTFPGRSGGSGDSWSAYKFAPPVTLVREATIAHSYAVGSSPTPDATFLVTDNGIAVDYIGVQNPANGVGFTSPASAPSSYVISSEVRLWRGNIWEKITKTVNAP
jgi:hypothetical protein